MKRTPFTAHFSLLVLLLSSSLLAASAIKPPPVALPVPGTLLIHGGGNLPASFLPAFFKLAGGDSAKLVVIPTANVTDEEANVDAITKSWQSRGFKNVTIVHTTSRDKANEESFATPLTQATAVWIDGGLQSRLEKSYSGTPVEKELLKLLARDGVIAGSSAGAAIMSRTMITGGKDDQPQMGTGFDLLPSAILDQHFIARNRKARLLAALTAHPGYVGFGIDEGTVMVVRSRTIRVLGSSTVSICLPASKTEEAKIIELKEGEVADLVAMSRAAIERTKPPFPAEKILPAKGVAGTLVIVGGGGTPKEALDIFIEKSGGPDAPIAIISTALDETPPEKPGEVIMLTRAGAKNIRVLHAPTIEAAGDAKFLAAIAQCKGIWFSGGRQWRFVDKYLDTPAEKAFHNVLKSGGVIGGSSAGATIQGDYLVRGSPLGNTDMMALGYERGLAFMRSTAIDQHFAQRNRFKDMEAVKNRLPQLLGLGIDETTAVIVSGYEMKVVGKNNVYVYDKSQPAEGEAAYTKLKAGDEYDLKSRQKVIDVKCLCAEPRLNESRTPTTSLPRTF